MEALNQLGVTDPYEWYEHLHLFNIDTSLGSGIGGSESLVKVFRDRQEEKEVQNDVLQKT